MVAEKEDKKINKELQELYENTITDIKEGQIVKGKIVQINENEILVDIGYKSEGSVYKSEITNPEELNVGDEIDVFIVSKENDFGMVVLSHEKAKRTVGWQNIVDNYKEGDSIEGRIFRKVKGGFMVDIGIDAFLPASLAAMQDVGGGDSLLNQKYEFKIVKVNIPRKNIVLSRKEIVEEKRKEEKRVILDGLNKGDIVKGIIRNITDFGAFIDIGGGITGLLHITDMSWGRVNNPNEVVKIGDEIDVKILDFDKKGMKVSLGLKQIAENPWETIDEKYAEGTVVLGKVVNIMPYGIFVELENGIEGLIHISEFSWSKKVTNPNEQFKVGDTVEAMVLRVDKENQKLSLGIKQMGEDPWKGVEERYAVGNQVKGTVNAITDYGAFVELEKGIEGLVHVSDLSWTKRVNHPKEVIKKGDEIEAMILSVDEQNRRIALGVKQLTSDPWDEISKKYQSGSEWEGIITNITNFGIFVELEKDLEGLLHVTETNLKQSDKIEESYKVGDKVKVKIIHIDGVQKKIALSQKGIEQEPSEAPKETTAPAEEKEEAAISEEAPKEDIQQEEAKPVEDTPQEEEKPAE